MDDLLYNEIKEVWVCFYDIGPNDAEIATDMANKMTEIYFRLHYPDSKGWGNS